MHQGDVYPASFAAVPHVVSALASAPTRAGFDYFLFPACVEVARVKSPYPPNLRRVTPLRLPAFPGWRPRSHARGYMTRSANRHWLRLPPQLAMSLGLVYLLKLRAAISLRCWNGM
jgi:hypothetical protein